MNADFLESKKDNLKLVRHRKSGQVSSGEKIQTRQSDTPQKPPKRRFCLYKSRGVDSALRRNWGGARNKADRESWGLTENQVRNLVEATGYASCIGLPFTRMITIHWEKAGLRLEEMAWATGEFIKRLSRMLARQGQKTAWLWVHENGERSGYHAHILAHVPETFVKRLQKRQMQWLRQMTERAYRKRTILSRPIGGKLGLEESNVALLETNIAQVLGYNVKGAYNNVAQVLSLPRQRQGGRIIGKRCATSQNIGRKVRST